MKGWLSGFMLWVQAAAFASDTPVSEIAGSQPQKMELPNGIPLWVVADNQQNSVVISLQWQGGLRSAIEPAALLVESKTWLSRSRWMSQWRWSRLLTSLGIRREQVIENNSSRIQWAFQPDQVATGIQMMLRHVMRPNRRHWQQHRQRLLQHLMSTDPVLLHRNMVRRVMLGRLNGEHRQALHTLQTSSLRSAHRSFLAQGVQGIVVVGHVDKKRVYQILQGQRKLTFAKGQSESRQEYPKQRLIVDTGHGLMVRLSVLLPAPTVGSSDFAGWQLMHNILTGNHGRLEQQLDKYEALVYETSTASTAEYVEIFAHVHIEQLTRMMLAIRASLDEMVNLKPTVMEVRRAVAANRRIYLLRRLNPWLLCRDLAVVQGAGGKVDDWYRSIAKQQISLADLPSLGKRYFHPSHASWVVTGDRKKIREQDLKSSW